MDCLLLDGIYEFSPSLSEEARKPALPKLLPVRNTSITLQGSGVRFRLGGSLYCQRRKPEDKNVQYPAFVKAVLDND